VEEGEGESVKVIQYPDLTEVLHPSNYSRSETEFIFYLQAPLSNTPYTLKGKGFTPVASMNNWWPTHAGEERRLTLWWLKVPTNAGNEVKAGRNRWGYSSAKDKYSQIEKHLAKSGCGLKIGEPPLLSKYFHKFFTLMRMPLDIKPIQQKWLTRHNYRHIDTGAMASYWVNGWEPNKYSIELEYEFFKTNQQEWKEHGLDGY